MLKNGIIALALNFNIKVKYIMDKEVSDTQKEVEDLRYILDFLISADKSKDTAEKLINAYRNVKNVCETPYEDLVEDDKISSKLASFKKFILKCKIRFKVTKDKNLKNKIEYQRNKLC